ncbi:hypothetical protein MMC12_006339 [Toensbergia leucococca]|nr:hypothetical protein [Toensbergia leucococca]
MHQIHDILLLFPLTPLIHAAPQDYHPPTSLTLTTTAPITAPTGSPDNTPPTPTLPGTFIPNINAHLMSSNNSFQPSAPIPGLPSHQPPLCYDFATVPLTNYTYCTTYTPTANKTSPGLTLTSVNSTFWSQLYPQSGCQGNTDTLPPRLWAATDVEFESCVFALGTVAGGSSVGFGVRLGGMGVGIL